MLAIIDSDSICVASAAQACKNKDENGIGIWDEEEVIHAYSNVKNKMMSILEKTGCTDYEAFLSQSKDASSFRLKIYPEYKAHRVKTPRPIYEQKAREYLINHWQADVVQEIEADDAVSIIQYELYKGEFEDNPAATTALEWVYPAVLCGIDKDLDQVPGLHYNYNKDIFYYITPMQGLRNLYLQMLTGDVADNIPRVKKGWRQAKAEEKINKACTEKELYDIIYEEHRALEIDKIEERIQWLGSLLMLRKHPTDEYRIPT